VPPVRKIRPAIDESQARPETFAAFLCFVTKAAAAACMRGAGKPQIANLATTLCRAGHGALAMNPRGIILFKHNFLIDQTTWSRTPTTR
jgi:hypothetical protein